MEFREILLKLKIYYDVESNKDLAKKLGLTEDGVKNWVRKKAIPKKYLKQIENNINQKGNNNINISGINNGGIHISSENEIDRKLCEIIKELSTRRKEYYFYKISAELIENESKN